MVSNLGDVLVSDLRDLWGCGVVSFAPQHSLATPQSHVRFRCSDLKEAVCGCATTPCPCTHFANRASDTALGLTRQVPVTSEWKALVNRNWRICVPQERTSLRTPERIQSSSVGEYV